MLGLGAGGGGGAGGTGAGTAVGSGMVMGMGDGGVGQENSDEYWNALIDGELFLALLNRTGVRVADRGRYSWDDGNDE